ncbi:hypothetical protein C8J57DRAFT_1278591, partial [Mycena rebaudengoi]
MQLLFNPAVLIFAASALRASNAAAFAVGSPLFQRSPASNFVAPTPTTDPQGSPMLRALYEPILPRRAPASSFVAPTMKTDPQGSPVLREIDDYPKEDDQILLRRS